MNFELRPLLREDESIVWQMLVYAAHKPSLKSVQTQPNLAQYAAGWGRKGDMGCVALLDQLPIGATWLRLWSNGNKGFGYIDDSIPELAIAVLPEYRGRGIGTQLLNKVLEEAQNKFPAISLSVRSDNPAVGLYQRVGFVTVEDSEKSNRVGGSSVTMVYQITD